MALFKNMSITNKGMALFTKAQAGQPIKFTKMKVGSGDIGTQNPASLIDLVEGQLDIPIASITPMPEEKSATIIGNINNSGLLDPVYICEIGIYAEDPDEGEILYGYSNSGNYGDYYAPESQGPYSWQYQIAVAIGNAANVTVELAELNFDYAVINTNTTFMILSGGNQKEINKNIDTKIKNQQDNIAGLSTQVTKNKNDITEVSAQMADNANEHGNLALLETTEKTNLVGSINELFTNVSSGKQLVGGAITGVDDSVVIPTDPTFNDLASAIGGISTGKKWASGFSTPAIVGSHPMITVSGLSFKPSVILAYADTTYRLIYWEPMSGFNKYLRLTGSSRVDTENVTINGGNIKSDGFYLYVHTGAAWNWIAFE